MLALDRAPQGAEHIKQLLIGSILTITPQEVAQIALLYAAIGGVHLIFRQPLLEVSFHGLLAAALRRNVLFWDVVFYGSFALVVTSSVRIAGVLLVFSYLIIPAALAGLLWRSCEGGSSSHGRSGPGSRRSVSMPPGRGTCRPVQRSSPRSGQRPPWWFSAFRYRS